MAQWLQWLRALNALLGDPGSIPRTHMVIHYCQFKEIRNIFLASSVTTQVVHRYNMQAKHPQR